MGYWCIYCEREIVPEEHENGDLYIHDDVYHPPTFNHTDERIEQ